MGIPVVVCYSTREALKKLDQCGIGSIEIIRTGNGFKHQKLADDERVICQRLVKDKVILIVS
jgi:hypothetical protein